jgi:hypothetical protein
LREEEDPDVKHVLPRGGEVSEGKRKKNQATKKHNPALKFSSNGRERR